METKKNKVWIVGCIGFTIGIMLLLAGCGAKWHIADKHLESGPYPAIQGLPKVRDGYEGLYFGWIEVVGSKKTALKAAASQGANYVKLKPATISCEVTEWDYYDDGDTVRQRKIGTKMVDRRGYRVSLYR
jgi:hypothetical protein